MSEVTGEMSITGIIENEDVTRKIRMRPDLGIELSSSQPRSCWKNDNVRLFLFALSNDRSFFLMQRGIVLFRARAALMTLTFCLDTESKQRNQGCGQNC